MTRLSIISATWTPRAVVCATALALLGACASPDPALTRAAPYDPFEESNRINHENSKRVDRAIIRPVAQGYSAIMPDPAETAISNFATNLSLPGAMVNSALQGNGVGMTSDFYRFLVNSTLGLGGMIDVATKLNMPAATDADFGQTLYTWGVNEGPYIELPLLGPSTSRAVAGRVVDLFTNPLGYVIEEPEIYYTTTARGARALTGRGRYSESINSVLDDSADSYAATRSLYLQNRRYKVGRGGSDAYLDPNDTTGSDAATQAVRPAVSADFEDPYEQ
ncbi:VacJ family lipoprotein [Roseovarius sp. M141]|uniref:MlaA family lipoprotein n=1 Tax=Roseovarius sp. M141 TaxID=2583806 RepID=UPI0020CFAE43|nr:VacJ family lipoprotein [Roseovarius sp. M141]